MFNTKTFFPAMKSILFSVLLLMSTGLVSMAQNKIDLTLRYNSSLSRYEVYAKPNFSQANFLWGASQIAIVTPSSVTDAPFNLTSVAAGQWQDNSQVYAPSAAATSDFHGIGSLGAATNLSSGQEALLFHFTLPGGTCVNGLRLFVNGTDPNSAAAGMNGGDFGNSITNNTAAEVYGVNYANTGSQCSACSLVAPTLN
jgi:hypothetical protein